MRYIGARDRELSALARSLNQTIPKLIEKGNHSGNNMQMEMQMEEQRVKGSSKRDKVIEEWKPYILCIFSNVCFAGFNIVSRVSLDKGMSRYVLVVYGHAFGTLATALLAFLFERFIVFILVNLGP